MHLLEEGGEARPVGDIAGSVEQIRFSADGRTMLALAADPGSDRAGAESATRIDEAEADPRVTSPAEHWRRLFRIDLATGATERVGPDGVNVWEFDWRGGDVAAIVSDDPSESGWYASRVVLIDLAAERRRRDPPAALPAGARAPGAGRPHRRRRRGLLLRPGDPRGRDNGRRAG